MGTGNGHLLFELVANGYSGKHLKGVDYSPSSIKLSQSIARTRGSGCEEVSFDVIDVLDQQQIKEAGEWDVVMDKGTFGEYEHLRERSKPLQMRSACLPVRIDYYMPSTPRTWLEKTASCSSHRATSPRTRSRRLSRAKTVRRPPSEPVHTLTARCVEFAYHSRIQHPTFSFGGSKGSTICTIAFERI